MVNAQDFIEKSNLFRKLIVDELLFAEIKCPVDDDESSGDLWWHHHFFAYAMAGEMVLKTLKGEYIFKAGDCIFAKKGSIISARHRIQADFCELRVFVPDGFIKSVVQKYKLTLPNPKNPKDTDTILPLITDNVLDAYFHSLLPHFDRTGQHSKILLKLKFEELLIHVLSTHRHHNLQCFCGEICKSSYSSIRDIMEANFIKNLSIEEFARLCGRSLSAFKVEFKEIYHATPGRWLRNKRLEYGRYLLETTDKQINEISDMSGFENTSHFIRVFKNKYGLPPGRFKLEINLHRGEKHF